MDFTRGFARDDCAKAGLKKQGWCDAAVNYEDEDFIWAFDFLPGEAGGMKPVKRQLIPSIFLPFSYLIERHVMISPWEASSER